MLQTRQYSGENVCVVADDNLNSMLRNKINGGKNEIFKIIKKILI